MRKSLTAPTISEDNGVQVTTDLSAWGLPPEVMKALPSEQRDLILSLLNRIASEGRNWERFKWLLQVILPSRFEGVGEARSGVTVNTSIKFTVEEHKAIKADYAKLSEQADRLLNNTNGETQ